VSSKPELHFYFRDGCHLCEEMAAAIHAGWPQVMTDMVWVDVDSAPEIRERYGLKVPVLTYDGETVCEYRLDPEAMAVYFGTDALPV